MAAHDCGWCDSSFHEEERLNEHILEYHWTIQCSWCKKDGFLDWVELLEHVEAWHPERIPGNHQN